MFCGNCGTNNQDGTAFCANCGAPLVANAQPEYAQPEYAQPGYAPAAPKKNYLPIIIGAVAVVVVAVLLIVLLGGGHGYSEPEDAALAWVEGMCDLDAGDMLSAVYPEMADEIEEDLEEDCEDAEEYVDEYDVSFSDFKAKEKDYEIREEQLKLYEEWFNDEYDTDVEITDMKQIKVTYEIEADGKTDDTSETVTVVEIDGDWYVWPSSYIDVDIDFSGIYDEYSSYDYSDYDFGY